MRDDLPHHLPVLHTTVCSMLSPRPGETVLDVTLGLAGHARSFAEAVGESGTLIAIDADTQNMARAKEVLAQTPATVILHHANFLEMPHLDLPPLDIVFADLGLSSPHLDLPERGFAFKSDGPLDMRYDQGRGESASDLIRHVSVDTLRRILREYGELAQAQRLAHLLAGKTVATTGELRGLIEAEYGEFVTKKLLPQVFQALRIAVNRELEAVDVLLEEGPRLLKPGGRMGVISYHSLEDRKVKQAFKTLTTPEKDPLTGKVSKPAPFALIEPHLVIPSSEEQDANPRSRSAKFRALRRL